VLPTLFGWQRGAFSLSDARKRANRRPRFAQSHGGLTRGKFTIAELTARRRSYAPATVLELDRHNYSRPSGASECRAASSESGDSPPMMRCATAGSKSLS